MKTEVIMDTNFISQTLSQIENLASTTRKDLDAIISANADANSYSELEKSKNLMKLYGDAADAYAKLCYIQSGVSEAMLDLRTVRKTLASSEAAIPPSLIKSFRYRIDGMLEDLGILKEAIQSARLGMEARVRYFNSCAYTSYDKVIGAKC